MSEPVDLPMVDTEPGRWVEHDQMVLTAAEIVDGDRLGIEIDQDDDADNGGIVTAR